MPEVEDGEKAVDKQEKNIDGQSMDEGEVGNQDQVVVEEV